MVSNSMAVALFCIISLGVLAFGRPGKRNSSASEPPSVASSIPLIGHLVGLLKHQTYYYEKVRDQANGAPIFALPILGAKTYIVAAPHLITAVQRTKTIAFEPVVASALKGVSGCSPDAEAIVTKNLSPTEGNAGFLKDFAKTMHASLSPGPNLKSMNRTALRDIEKFVDLLAEGQGQIRLVEWLRHILTIATTNAVYGPANPFANESVEQAFWTFEENLMSLIINILPSVTAKAGSTARSIVCKAFRFYFSEGHHLSGSILTRARVDYLTRFGVTLEDVAAFEGGGALALMANTYPITFWMLRYVYSKPEVLQECRDEIANITKPSKKDGVSCSLIDVDAIKTSCPLLTSILQETLRYVGVGSAVRELTDNTLLDGQWHLRKGMKVITPSNVLHTDKIIWGSDADVFQHRRFIGAEGRTKLLNPVAFRAFGGGTTLCPGRHFATTEILATAAMLIARFDIKPAIGAWPEPNRENSKLWAQIIEPPHDIQMSIVERVECKGQLWRFEERDRISLLALVAEDMKEEN